MSSNATPTLQSFNPHAVHYFTSAAASTRQPYPTTHSGVPRAAYPNHVLAASASPAAASQTLKNISVPSSQTTPPSSSLSSSLSSSSSSSGSNAPNAMKIQAPKPTVQAKGFTVSGLGAGAAAGAQGRAKGIFEPFSHQRSVTPELDDVLKKKAAPWGQWELEQSFHSSK